MNQTAILIVEDEAVVAADISGTLRKMGYHVAGICNSGEETLKVISGKQVDLILMDIHIMGDMDGIELATMIRREKRIPVIFLTAYSDDNTLSRAKTAEPFGYLSKSFYYRDIKTTIETALYRNKMKLQVEEKEELLSLTLKSIEEAVITTEDDGKIIFYNRRAEELFSLPPGDEKFETAPVIPDFLEFYSDTGSTVDNILGCSDFQELITLVNPLEKKIVPLECSVSKNLRTEKGDIQNVHVFRDISNNLKMREMESLLSAVVESSEDLIAAVSVAGKVKSWNKGAEKILGIPAESAVGKQLQELIPQAALPPFNKFIENLQALEFVVHGEKTGDGQEQQEDSRFIFAHLTPLRDDRGVLSGYSFVGRDFTARTALEKKITEAEDNVRARIGRDLHDNLGQQLTGISLKLQALRNGLSRENYEAAGSLSDELQELIKGAIKETRELSRSLVPAILKDEGLPQALKGLAGYLERVYGITAVCGLDEEIVLNDSIGSQLYHIAQESVNNAVRHGKAEKIELLLTRRDGEILMSVQDNGSGFKEKEINRGLGLDNMRYRADIIRGKLEIESSPETGTKVSCRIIAQN